MERTRELRRSAARDFDFLAGTWHVRHRRLLRRLAGCDDWETFEATTAVQALPGGVANFDTTHAEAWRPGWVGMAFRLFDPRTNLWSIHWCTNDGGGIDRDTGRLEPPVVGRFDGDVGVFEGDDVFEGRAIRVRYQWTRRGDGAAEWRQSFRPSGSEAWEVNWIMDFERLGDAPAAISAPAADIACDVVELRRYTLHPGRRETLIELFDTAFVESQEALGMAVMGQFRDLDAPDRFVWLRGFPDMEVRAAGLAAFYGGPVWRARRDAANTTMVDSDDVLLLRPAWPGAGIRMAGRTRSVDGVRASLPGLVAASVFTLREPAPDDLLAVCRDVLSPTLGDASAAVLGWYVTHDVENDVPQLPVREGEHVLVALALFDSAEHLASFERSRRWSTDAEPALARWIATPPTLSRWLPTSRSAVHG